jgi:hypothetical protein
MLSSPGGELFGAFDVFVVKLKLKLKRERQVPRIRSVK